MASLERCPIQRIQKMGKQRDRGSGRGNWGSRNPITILIFQYISLYYVGIMSKCISSFLCHWGLTRATDLT